MAAPERIQRNMKGLSKSTGRILGFSCRAFLCVTGREYCIAALGKHMILIMSEVWLEIFTDAPERSLGRGETVVRQGDPVRRMYLVREGCIELKRPQADGGMLTLHKAETGSLLAEASLFAQRYHCDATCNASTRVAHLPKTDVLNTLEQRGLGLLALSASAREVQTLRSRLEIMRLKALRNRLDAYLELYGKPDAGGWVRVADWIGVTPEALYRELARRRKAQKP